MNFAKFLLCLFLFSSCHLITPNGVKYEFTQCYDGKIVDPDAKFNKNGYWSYESINRYYTGPNNDKLILIDTTIHTMVFYPDGLFVGDLIFENPDLDMRYSVIPDNELKNLKNWVAIGTLHGKYLIRNDTIIVQEVSRTSNFSTPWYVFETWYKIVDPNTIIQIARTKQLFPNESSESDYVVKPDSGSIHLYKPRTIKFRAFDVLPSANSWIKKKKWFWCDEIVGK